MLGIIGLSLDIIGVILILKWGLPMPDMEVGVELLLESATQLSNGGKVSDVEAKQIRTRKIHKLMSIIGLSLILAGFVLQLIDQLTRVV